MKRIFLLSAIALMTALPLSAQKIVIGNRMPEIKAKWLGQTPHTDGKAVMVEFFHSSNDKSVERLEMLDILAANGKDMVTVIVVVSESDEEGAAMLKGTNHAYFAAVDDSGKTFSAFSARYIPYSVISDKKGRVIWLGNPASLTHEEIVKIVKQ